MMEPLNVTFVPGNIQEMEARFGQARSSFPTKSLRDYFRFPDRELAEELKAEKHVLAFTTQVSPQDPVKVWYLIKTAAVAQVVLNAPRYAAPESGKPWGEGPHTAILRLGLGVDGSPGAGTNNVMTTSADKHEAFRSPLREGLIKNLDEYTPAMVNCIESWIAENTQDDVLDLNSFCRGLVQKTVLTIVGLPDDAVTMQEISQLNLLAHEIAQKVEGANERMRAFREAIDKKVVEGLKTLKKGTLFWSLKQKGYSDLACRETIVALMIGARNGSTALLQMLWMLARHPEMQESWKKSGNQEHILQNLFRYSLLTHSPVRTMNRNAIHPMVLKISDGKSEECYGIYPGDRVDYLMGEAPKAEAKRVDISSCFEDKLVSQAHLPFGVGPNQCPASRFIESIAKITTGILLRRFNLECSIEHVRVEPNVFVNEFADEPVFVRLL